MHEGEGEGAERAGKIASTCRPRLSRGLQEDHVEEISTGRDSERKLWKVVSDFWATTMEGWFHIDFSPMFMEGWFILLGQGWLIFPCRRYWRFTWSPLPHVRKVS